MGREIDLLKFPYVNRTIGNRTDEHRAIARRFDHEFFDGDRAVGYGGYYYDGRFRPVARRMVSHYRLPPYSKILDIGCAKGFLVEDFNAEIMDAWGIDVSWYAIANSVAGPGRVKVGSATDLSEYEDKEFDLVVSLTTLHNLEKDALAKALQEIMRISNNAYITLDAYRNEMEKERMLAWNLTALTIMSVDEWKKFFKEVGYTGDYGWFIP